MPFLSVKVPLDFKDTLAKNEKILYNYNELKCV